MAFKGMTITNAGKRLLAQAQANKAFSIKCIRIGDGNYNGDYHDITNLVHALYDAPCAINHSNNNLTIEADISSNDHSGYYFREVALIALDSNNNEIVYAYDNAGDDAEYINPSEDGLAFEKRLKFFFTVVDSINVTVELTGSMYALKDGDVSETFVQFDEKTANTNEVKSGDKLKVILAKLLNLFKRVKNIEDNGVTGGDTLPITGGFSFSGTEEELPDGFTKKTPPFSNDNIAINPDFKVWQEGEEMTVTSGRYVADVWRIYLIDAGSVTIKKVPNGLQVVRFNNSGSNPSVNIYQLKEEDQMLENAKCTVQESVNNVIRSYSRVLKHDEQRIINLVSINDLKAGDIANWIKVELGDMATPLVPRSYTEELVLCQRYFIGEIMCIGLPYSRKTTTEQYFWVFCSFPRKMRITPSVGILSAYISNIGAIPTGSIGVIAINDLGIYGNVTIKTNVDMQSSSLINYPLNMKLILDARFY